MNSRHSATWQMPRHALHWILAAVVMVLLPHILRLPFWLTGLCIVCLLYRVLIFQGRISFPGGKLKTALVALALGGTILQFGRALFSTDAMVALLIAGIALKLLETHSRRDVYLLIYLCYFTGVAAFIYSQSIPLAGYMLLVNLVITAGLIAMNQGQDADKQRAGRALKRSAVILAQSVPLMLVLFIVFPRISPLWSMPIQSSKGVTGLSDSMSPGDIGNLARSGEVVFRVQFEDEIPESSALYWRGLTLDLFNGRDWTRLERRFNPDNQSLGISDEFADWYQDIEYRGNAIDYNVILEPTNQRWLFTLMMPHINREGLQMLDNYQVESIRPVGQRFSYDVRTYPEFSTREQLSPDVRRRALSLPNAGNEISRRFARDLRERAGSDMAFAGAVLDYFTEQPFYYTLQPAVLGQNAIDQFLFETGQGFCEHYASAFTFLMRAAGIPSRVVTGYQGGEINPYDNTLIVRQYDAHAWSEIWLEGQGWVRMDPTAAVAPQRISMGSEQTFQEDDSFLSESGFSMLRFRRVQLLNTLRWRLETIDYAWSRLVINYDQGTQFALITRLSNLLSFNRTAITFLAAGGLLFASTLLATFLRRRKTAKHSNPATEAYLKFCRKLAKSGYERKRGETPLQYSRRISKAQPTWKEAIERVTRHYIVLTYNKPKPGQAKQLQHLKQSIRTFKPHTARYNSNTP